MHSQIYRQYAVLNLDSFNILYKQIYEEIINEDIIIKKGPFLWAFFRSLKLQQEEVIKSGKLFRHVKLYLNRLFHLLQRRGDQQWHQQF